MKKVIFFLYLLFGALTADSQSATFSFISLGRSHQGELMRFCLPMESNTRYFRIEAGDDSLNLQLIATIPSKGNSVLPVQYNFDLAGFNYNYYRVGITKMDGSITWSPVVFKSKTIERPATPQDSIKAKEYYTAY